MWCVSMESTPPYATHAMKYTGQSSPLYRTQAWLKKRQAQLAAEPLCRYCRQQGRLSAASVADHITPHKGDPTLFWGELQSLCKPCHDGAKQELERTGRLRGAAADGTPLDPGHHWNSG
jgi:5-methylcytosine-specific restriction protein A